MKRRLRVGDSVRAFLDSRICGTIEAIVTEGSNHLMVGGVPASVSYAIVKTESGQKVKVKTTELFYDS